MKRKAARIQSISTPGKRNGQIYDGRHGAVNTAHAVAAALTPRPRPRGATAARAAPPANRAGSRPDIWPWLAAAAALVVRGVVLSQLHEHPLLQPAGVLDDAE